jgi:sigma-E factor negative regulatory protein RseC
MMNSVNYLEQAGLVTDYRNGRIKISLVGSGCSACHKSLCMLGDSKAKEVEVPEKGYQLKIGDEVMVKVNPSSGYKAVVLLYLLPFLLMLLSLMFLLHLGYPESISGLLSLLILMPYFSMIYGLRKKLGSQCKIEVVKK